MKLKTTLMCGALGLLLCLPAEPALALRAVPTYTAVALDSPDPEAEALFGSAMDAVGDLNGDGVNDVAVASPRQSSGGDPGVGRVWVFSGRTRDLIRTIPNPDPQPNGGFGDSIISIGDVTGDKVPDLAIGGSGVDVAGNPGQGRVYIFSGRTSSLIRRIDNPTPQAGTNFGAGTAQALGDINGDGFGDFIESAYSTVGICDFGYGNGPEPCQYAGRAWAFSGKDGSVIHQFDDPAGPSYFGQFGTLSSNPGDVTGDGIGDIVLYGASLYLFNGKTGKLVYKVVDPAAGTDDGHGFGYNAGVGVHPGDVNGDGVNDLLVGSPGLDVGGVGNAGRLYLLSGTDSSLIRTLDDPNPKESGSLGFFHASAGDLNGDGTPDVLGMRFIFTDGRPGHQPLDAYGSVPPPGGATYVFDGKTGAVLVSLPGMAPEGPGSGLASPGDVNGDGYPDYFLGARGINSGAGTRSGRVIVELSNGPTGTPAPSPAAAGSPPSTNTPTPTTTTVLVAKKRIRVRLVLRVTPRRDRTFPYSYTATGRVILPPGVSRSKVCRTGSGTVQSKVYLANTISSRRGKLNRLCTFKVHIKFSIRKRLGRLPAGIKMVGRFRGNSFLAPAKSKPVFVKAG